MAAPTASARLAPAGFYLPDGYSTKISPLANTNIAFFEKTVQPFGWDGGEVIPTTTMHNVEFRTFHPRSLKTLTESVVVAAYDPLVMDEIEALINVNTAWTIHYPDTSTYVAWAVLTRAIPQPHEEGTQPEMELTIVPTNYDDANCVEAGPVLVSYGTC